MTDTRKDLPIVRSTRTVAWSGVVLALVLAYLMGYLVYRDHQLRLDAARRQSMALAEGTERLLRLELRNLERAMAGIAGDARQAFRTVPESAPVLLGEAVAGVVQRHQELHSIVIVDGRGQAITPGHGLPAPPPSRDAGSRALRFGGLQQVDGEWVLPLLMAMEDGRWIVTRLRIAEIQRLLAGLDTGRDGVVTVMDHAGTVLARSRDAARYLGRRYPDVLPAGPPYAASVMSRRSGVDGVVRITSRMYLDDYGVFVSAGLGRTEILRDWYLLLFGSLAVYGLYWAGFLYLLRHIRQAARAQNQLLSEVGRTAEGLRLAQRIGRTGSWRVHRSPPRVEWSEQVSEIFGLAPDRNSACNEEFYALVHPEDREPLRARFAQAWQSHEPFVAEYRVIRPDGQVRWLLTRGGTIEQAGDVTGMVGTLLDITNERSAQARALETERQYRLLFERNPMPFWVFDLETLRFLEVNDAAVRHYGYSREEFLAMTVLDIRPPRGSVDVLQSPSEPAPSPEGELWKHLKKDGSVIDVHVRTETINYNGRSARLVLAEDISETLAYERELNYRASHDAATGLLNLPGLKTRLAAEGKGPYALAYLQLRGLELVTDSLGQAVATRLLDTLANRLETLADPWGETAFVPSEAFVVALRPDVDVEAAVGALHRAMTLPLEQGGSRRTLEAWAGVAHFDGTGFENAVSHAALAAHVARSQGVPSRTFDARMAQAAGERLRMIGRIHVSLEQRDFMLYFQPIYRLQDRHPVCLEALLRWPQADGSFVPPSQFIPLSEDAGLIPALGDWVMEEAARCHRKLVDAGWASLPIAVNVSPAQLRRADFADRLIRLHERFGLPRGALHIEVTESMLLDSPESTMRTLRTLQKHGICTSLDDFGTGFSSMSYLHQLPLDALKIDQAFVRNVADDDRSAAICHAMISLGHSLGLTLVAEGVETQAQLDWLHRHHCDQVQGYLLARPMDLARTLEHLAVASVPERRQGG